MNFDQFDKLKVGDKVVVASIKNPDCHRYSRKEVRDYKGHTGVVSWKYCDVQRYKGTGIHIIFEDGDSWTYNTEDVELVNETEKDKEIMSNKTPHIHAELIKAWADGAKIEYYSESHRKWYELAEPVWGDMLQYRIKKEKVLKYKYAFHSELQHCSTISAYFYKDDKEFLDQNPMNKEFQRLDFTATEFEVEA